MGYLTSRVFLHLYLTMLSLSAKRKSIAHLALTGEQSLRPTFSLFANVKMQALVQPQRHVVFSIFDSLIARYRQGELIVPIFMSRSPEVCLALKDMGNDFLTGYIALADGERDPRNLMVAFAIARVLLIEFDIRDKVEVLHFILNLHSVFPKFMFLYRTFSISYIATSPSHFDPRPMTQTSTSLPMTFGKRWCMFSTRWLFTASELTSLCRLCLSATPAFGEPAIHQFLEKLNMGSPTVKVSF